MGWVGVEQEWSKGGALVTALAPQQCGPRSNPGVDAIRELSLLYVLLLDPRGFSPRDTFLPLSSKLSSNMHSTSKVRMGLKFPGIFSPTRQNLKEFQRNPFNRKFWKSDNKIEWNGNFQEENFKNLGQPREVFVLLRKLWKTWKILFY